VTCFPLARAPATCSRRAPATCHARRAPATCHARRAPATCHAHRGQPCSGRKTRMGRGWGGGEDVGRACRQVRRETARPKSCASLRGLRECIQHPRRQKCGSQGQGRASTSSRCSGRAKGYGRGGVIWVCGCDARHLLRGFCTGGAARRHLRDGNKSPIPRVEFRSSAALYPCPVFRTQHEPNGSKIMFGIHSGFLFF